MIEFQHLITQSEVDSQFINLTDTSSNKYGNQIGKHDKVLKVLNDAGNEFEMKRHHGNQLTRCGAWFTENSIKADTLLTIRFDPQTATIHLLSEPPSSPPAASSLASVSFTRNGDYYEIRCIADGEVLRVCGFRDGKQIGGFDFPETPQSRKPRRRMDKYI